MNYFEKYSSNTVAACGVQSFFLMDPCEVRTSRTFYKITCGGEFNYSFLFSNNVDSTFSDGSFSRCNTVCDGWNLIEACVGVCRADAIGEDIMSAETAKTANESVVGLTALTFGGNVCKKSESGEIFYSDEIKLNIASGDYLCLQITYSGNMLPYFEETMLPVYLKRNGDWEYCNKTPVVSLIGCDRKAKKRIAFFGDSITQGIGAGYNSYKNYCALLADKLGTDYAYHNLGIGFGRAHDAASNGFWLSKAKQNDIVFVCFGVNDMFQIGSEEQIKNDLDYIVTELKKNGSKVIIQTLPPFHYSGNLITVWQNINEFIKTELSLKADFVFDNVPILGKSESEPYATVYGGHPDSVGCALWADALYKALPKELFQ